MEYLQPNSGQIVLFFRSAGFGFLLGALYDVLRFVRLAVGTKRALFVWDVLFGVLAAVSSFFYLLIYCDGQMRLFVFAALGAGFAVWHAFAAPAVRRRSDRFLALARGRLSKISAAAARQETRWAGRTKKLAEKFTKTLKKFQKSQKST